MKPIINPWLFYIVDCLEESKTLLTISLKK